MSFLVRCFKVGRHVYIPSRHRTQTAENIQDHSTQGSASPPNPSTQSPGEPTLTSFPHVTSRTDDGGFFMQDGFVSALSVALLLFAVNMAVVMSKWMTVDQSLGIGKSFLYVFCTLQFIGGAVLMLVMLCRQDAFLHPLPVQRPNASSAKWRRLLCDNLSIICMCVFLLIGLFRDVFPLYGEFGCMAVYTYCDHYWHYVIEIVYRFSRNVFLFVQIGFCIMAHKRVFKQTCAVSYFLLTIVAITLGQWFKNIIYVSRHIFYYGSYKWYTECNHIDQANTSFSEERIHKCLYWETYPFDLRKKASEFIYPVPIEFSMLVTEILLHLFFSIQPVEEKHKSTVDKPKPKSYRAGRGNEETLPLIDRGNQVQYMAIESPPTEMTISQKTAQLVPSCTKSCGRSVESRSHQASQTTAIEIFKINGHDLEIADEYVKNYIQALLLPPTLHQRRSQELEMHKNKPELSQQSTDELDSNKYKLPVIMTFTMLAVVLGIVLIVFGIFVDYKPSDTTATTTTTSDALLYAYGNSSVPIVDEARFYNYEASKLVCFVSLIFASFVSFWACESFSSKFANSPDFIHSYSGLETLLVLTSLGIFIDMAFSGVAGGAFLMNTEFDGHYMTDEKPHPRRPEFFTNYPQVFLAERLFNMFQIFHQTTLLMHVKNITVKGNCTMRRLMLIASLTWIIWANVFLWGIDTYIESSDSAYMPIYAYYYGDERYDFIQRTTMPFGQLYRISSFFLFVEVVLIQC